MSEEEIELRDLVAQTLENNGVLSRIRAELRSSVFLALEEQESMTESPRTSNKPLKTFLSTAEGSLVACLVREFLEFFHLDFTLSVFDPETSQGKYYNYGGRSKLIKDLQIEHLNGKKGPLLVQILHIVLGQNGDLLNVEKDIKKQISSTNNELHAYLLGNSQVQNVRDINSSNRTLGEKTIDLQIAGLSKIEDAIFTSNSNISSEARSSITTDMSKSTEINKITKMKDFPLPATTEELSPRSASVTDSISQTISTKEKNKSKTGSLDATPCNSPTSEQSPRHNKPESQDSLNSDTSHKSSSKSDSKKRKPQQNKTFTESATKPATSTLSSLGNLPPLMGVSFPTKPLGNLAPINQSVNKDMHQIKAMIDLGLESQDMYDEDFHSTASVSAKEEHTHHDSDTEIEEDLGSGVEDLLSSNTALDDLTADTTLTNMTGVADYMEDVK